MLKNKLPSLKVFLLVIAVYFFAVLFVYLVKNTNISPSLVSFFYLTTFPIIGWTAWLNKQQFGIKHPQGKAFLFFFVGICFAGMGEAVWFISQTFYNFGSAPTLSYIFYSIGYPLVFMAFISEIISLKIKWVSTHKLVSKIIIISTFLISMIVFKLEIFPVFQGGLDTSLKLQVLLFGLGDLVSVVLAAFVLRVAYEYEGGLFFNSWRAIFITPVLILAADILLVAYKATGLTNEFPDNIVHLLFFAANLIAAYGFYGIYTSLRGTQEDLMQMKQHQS